MSSVSITGRVTTLNISATKQVGQICATMTTADGREVFDECGALIGKIISVDPNTGTTMVSDTAVFDLMESFRTAEHAPQVTGVLETDADGNPCALSIREHITNLQWSTGIFANAVLDVYAEGIASFCPDKNLNTYQLSGQGCIRKHRR